MADTRGFQGDVLTPKRLMRASPPVAKCTSSTPARRPEMDDELWRKLEDKLSERTCGDPKEAQADGIALKGWLSHLFQGLRSRG